MAHITTNASLGANTFARLRAAFVGLREAWRQDARMRRTYNELSALTDRELADIGLRRCDIDDVVRHEFCAH